MSQGRQKIGEDGLKMRFQRTPFLSLFAAVLLLLAAGISGCTKEIREVVHENGVVTGNEPPPFSAVSTVALHSYINNFYIDLYGRGPTVTELDDVEQLIRNADSAALALDEHLAGMQIKWEYYKNYDATSKQRLVGSVDSLQILDRIENYTDKIQNLNASGDSLLALFFAFARDDLDRLLYSAVDLQAGSIDYAEYYRRMILNTFYDEVNMGSENFVLSCFENLFYREPTEQELIEGVHMVDGLPAFLFLQDGTTKREFVDICISSQPFYEGLVVEAFSALLARNPNSIEMALEGDELRTNNDYRALQRKIILSSEYAGF
jgi:hypothetical protein